MRKLKTEKETNKLQRAKKRKNRVAQSEQKTTQKRQIKNNKIVSPFQSMLILLMLLFVAWKEPSKQSGEPKPSKIYGDGAAQV